MDNEQLLFEMKKENILNNFKNGTGKDTALKYALDHNCYPFYHDDFKDFENFFDIKSDIQEPFYEYIYNLCEKGDYKTFDEIERYFRYSVFKNEKHQSFKYKMITMLKYAYLSGNLEDKEFQEHLITEGECPIEAKRIFKDYLPNE